MVLKTIKIIMAEIYKKNYEVISYEENKAE